MYRDLIENNIAKFEIVQPKTIVPTPSLSDYDLGYFDRYFIRKANDPAAFIFEIANDTYNDYYENPIWRTEVLKWRIVGPLSTIYKLDGTVSDIGVSETNKNAINKVAIKLKNIGLYLPNLLQFHK